MKSLIILGSTGSIGTQSLEVCQRQGYKVNGLAAGSNIQLLEAQARKFFKERDNAMNEDYEEPQVIKIFGMQIKKQPKKVEFTSIDNLIDWDDDEEWQE
jgi:1-deoxy-D-xylulose-5-phosphate reductoisomerase